MPIFVAVRAIQVPFTGGACGGKGCPKRPRNTVGTLAALRVDPSTLMCCGSGKVDSFGGNARVAVRLRPAHQGVFLFGQNPSLHDADLYPLSTTRGTSSASNFHEAIV